MHRATKIEKNMGAGSAEIKKGGYLAGNEKNGGKRLPGTVEST